MYGPPQYRADVGYSNNESNIGNWEPSIDNINTGGPGPWNDFGNTSVQNYTAPDRGDWGSGLHLNRGGIVSLMM